MALLKWELKKIWRPGLLLAIALIGLVFYDARPGFYLEYFWDSSDWRGAQAQLSSGWLEACGTTMEPEERAQLDGQLEDLEAEFARQAAQVPGAAEAGITDYESYLDWEADYHNSSQAGTRTEEDSDLSRAIYYTTNLNTIESLLQFMENYDTLAAGEVPEAWGGEVGDYSPAHQPSIRRVEDVRAEGVYGFLPGTVTNNTDNFFHYFAIWCVFSAVLLLSPTLVRDALRRTRAMQWTSRRGRGVLNAQMGAALLSGVLLTLLNCAVYLGPFLATGALRFRNCPLVSVWNAEFPWFDWTYGQYLLILLGLTFLLALAASGFTVVLSRFSASYVAMLLKAIPLIFVLCWGVVPWIMAGAGLFMSSPVRLTGLPGTEFLCAALAALLALALCVMTIRRQRKAEL
ncbi:ABC transporter permease [Intestinimonas massiliensis (ex Afouda et al. 2020)]|uniref:ABC transporter permease n=1 Tax=Intestinimonas massiliensis (ex Afouda et al. 2020) TaxID=1673721 RepID=UPI00102F3910|nr:ABC transporter permease [Intestinimonas massiliensis (ex Afouda et al. 2020)]